MPPAELHIIGVDPGGTTGWARITVSRASIYDDEPGAILSWDYDEVYGPEVDQVKTLARLVRETQSLAYRVGPAVVVEDFDIQAHNTTTDPELLSPVRIAAMLMYARFRGELGTDALIVMQGRAMAKSTATDDRLRQWGLYDRHSGDHCRDATRHAVTALRRARQKHAFRDAMWADPGRRLQ